jgi:hypothetical protein
MSHKPARFQTKKATFRLKTIAQPGATAYFLSPLFMRG